jgi:hypothetical protein
MPSCVKAAPPSTGPTARRRRRRSSSSWRRAPHERLERQEGIRRHPVQCAASGRAVLPHRGDLRTHKGQDGADDTIDLTWTTGRDPHPVEVPLPLPPEVPGPLAGTEGSRHAPVIPGRATGRVRHECGGHSVRDAVRPDGRAARQGGFAHRTAGAAHPRHAPGLPDRSAGHVDLPPRRVQLRIPSRIGLRLAEQAPLFSTRFETLWRKWNAMLLIDFSASGYLAARLENLETYVDREFFAKDRYDPRRPKPAPPRPR